MKKKLLYCYIVILLVILATTTVARAEEVVDQALSQIQAATGQAELEDPVAPQQIIMETIRRILALIGILFMALIVYGGFLYINARGEEEQIEKGKKIVMAAVIGIVIVLMAYSITLFVGTRVGPLVTEGGTVQR